MKKKKKNAEMDDLVQLGWCRPPMPTPQTESQSDEDHPYYSSPRAYKNHLEELKKMLRESEICDCGLRMLDAELGGGWTVHRSRENATYKRVFYQHEDGNTTWLFPTSITDLLSVQQVKFIVRLCKEANQDVPAQVIHRYQLMLSAWSRPGSGANISDLFGSNRSASLDQSPPVSGPAWGWQKLAYQPIIGVPSLSVIKVLRLIAVTTVWYGRLLNGATVFKWTSKLPEPLWSYIIKLICACWFVPKYTLTVWGYFSETISLKHKCFGLHLFKVSSLSSDTLLRSNASPLLGCGPDTGKRWIRRLNRTWICILRGFNKETRIKWIVQAPRECQNLKISLEPCV